MAEVGGHGLQLDGMVEDEVNGMTAQVLRLYLKPDPAPVLRAVDDYLRDGVKFDYAGAVLLGGTLLFKYARPTARWTRVTEAIFRFAARVLEEALRAYAGMPKRFPVMTCSQFVYQCFLDAGEEYRLQIEDGLLQGEAGDNPACDGSIRPADLIGGASDMRTGDPDGAETDPGALARELCLALEEGGGSGPLLTADAPEIRALAAQGKRFLDAAEACLRMSGSTLPLPALFVAPCDLAKAKNVLCYDTRRITRVQVR